jgi:hypothetical protein
MDNKKPSQDSEKKQLEPNSTEISYQNNQTSYDPTPQGYKSDYISPSQSQANQIPSSTPPKQQASKENPKSILTTRTNKVKGINARVLATILGIIFLALSVVSGVLLVQRQQRFTQKASDDINKESSRAYATCGSIKVYDTNWQQLSQNQIRSLKASDTVRFAIECSATSGSFDKARFTINGQTKEATTSKKEGTNEFFYEYEIPEGISSFKVKAEIHHSELGWF